MPLRDHFRAPLDERRHWEGFHATWPVMIVGLLHAKLPPRYFAEPRVHSGASAEIDVTTYESDDVVTPGTRGNGNGAVATAVWAPPRPTLAAVTDLPAQDLYEVLVYDEKRHCRLVAAVEIVSPANKDRPEHRRAFASKCVGLLRERVSVVIVDIVTTRNQNLYVDVLELMGKSDTSTRTDSPSLYHAACRLTRQGDEWLLQAWAQKLALGESIATAPLWLADDLAIPLELEASYEQSCRLLGID